MKSNEVEIFTVAFMVDNADAKTLLEGCASDAQHYYDASDPEALLAALSNIAQSLSHVRLARKSIARKSVKRFFEKAMRKQKPTAAHSV